MTTQGSPGHLPESSNILKYKLYLNDGKPSKSISTYRTFVNKLDPTGSSLFNLRKTRKNDVVKGSTPFGEKLEDEWLVIYYLFELSKFDPSLVIRIEDDYGEVLSIEAADCIPQWMHHERICKRVLIHQGKVHIIPNSIDLCSLQLLYGESKKVYHSPGHAAAEYVRDLNLEKTDRPLTRKRAKSWRIQQEPDCEPKVKIEPDTASEVLDQLIKHVDQGIKLEDTQLDADQPVEADDIFSNLPKVETLADVKVQACIEKTLNLLPDRVAWLENRMSDIDRLLGLDEDEETELTLDRVRSMNEIDLEISSISSAASLEFTVPVGRDVARTPRRKTRRQRIDVRNKENVDTNNTTLGL